MCHPFCFSLVAGFAAEHKRYIEVQSEDKYEQLEFFCQFCKFQR